MRRALAQLLLLYGKKKTFHTVIKVHIEGKSKGNRRVVELSLRLQTNGDYVVCRMSYVVCQSQSQSQKIIYFLLTYDLRLMTFFNALHPSYPQHRYQPAKAHLIQQQIPFLHVPYQ